MGSVYKAYDAVLDRFVALKLLHSELSSDAAAIQRLKREIQLTSLITNAHVVRTYDFGELHGACYISMALIEGRNLREILKQRGRLDPATAIRYAIQIATALDAAHQAGVIHRDLKPGNVLIDAEEHVFVADFGLAKQMEEDASLIAEGQGPGTPQYMSPEQCFGIPLDQRTDIFSFGAVFYEMITGEPPFAGFELLHAIQAGRTLEPKNPRSLQPEISDELSRLIGGCLRQAPEERYPTMSEVLQELVALGRVEGRPEKEPQRVLSGSLLARWRQLVVYSVAGLVAILVFLPGPKMQTLWRGSGSGENASALGVYREAKDAMARQRSTAGIEDVIRHLQSALKIDPKLALAHAAMVEPALLLYQETHEPRWLELARAAAFRARDLNPDLPQTRMALARLEIYAGHPAEAVRQLKKVLESTPDSDEAWRILGRAYAGIGSTEESVRAGKEAVRSNPADWRNHDVLASLLFAANRLPEAEAEYQTVLKLSARRADTYNNLGVIYLESGSLEKAVQMLEKALQMDPRPAYFSNVGAAYLASGQYRLAATLFEKAASLQPKSSALRANLAEACRLSNQHREASEALGQAIRLTRDELAVNPNDRTAKTSLALYYARMEDFAAAQKLLDELETRNANDCEVTYARAVLYLLEHRVSNSLAALEQALQQGFPAWRALQSPDWTPMRQEPQFRKLENQYKIRVR
jgi:eukaryotic-like serine/threonine-protein kinase